jgi:uncharacterized protein (DUF2225 family)
MRDYFSLDKDSKEEEFSLLPCPSCGFKFPKVMVKKRIVKKQETLQWDYKPLYSVKCPMCIMQSGPIDIKSWAVSCWNQRK